MKEAYERILRRNTIDDDDARSEVVRALSVVLAADRPFTIREIQCAVKMELEELPSSHEDLDLEENIDDFRSNLLEWCGLFLQIHGHDDEVALFTRLPENSYWQPPASRLPQM